MLVELYLHQTHHTVADFKAISTYLKEALEKGKEGLHVFCELFLTGYPLADLCLQKSFREQYTRELSSLNAFSKALPKRNITFLLGGLEYHLSESGFPSIIRNVVYKITPSKPLQAVYAKMLLPNYDIFDEAKYCHPGTGSYVFNANGRKVGLLICEDMWYSPIYPLDPVELLHQHITEKKIKLDLIVNLSASPYHLYKGEVRLARAKEISKVFAVPFAYINRVGGEDGILFDGQSFVVHGEEVVAQLPKFQAGVLTVGPLPKKALKKDVSFKSHIDSREFIFKPRLDLSHSPPRIQSLGDTECAEVVEAIGFGIQEYAKKCGLHKFLVALSGGIDSALTITLVKLSLKEGQHLEAIYMPSEFSSSKSTNLSYKLCEKLGIQLFQFPIKFLHSIMRNSFMAHLVTPLEGSAMKIFNAA